MQDLARLADEASRMAMAGKEKDAPTVRHADLNDTPEAQAVAQPTADSHSAPTPAAPAHAAPATGAHGSAAHVDTQGKIDLPPKPSFALPPRPASQPVPAEEPAHAAAPAHAEPAKPAVEAHAPPPAKKPVVKRVASKPKPRPKAKPKVVQVAMNTHAEEPAPPMVVAHKDIHWGYEGAGAPAKWGQLNPAWKTCDSGKRQSPIDIRDGIKVDLEPIKFDYVPTYFRINNNGHTVRIGVGPGSTMTVMGRTFDLVQFHFHRPSEERINGRGFDMVAHLVHKDLDGRLAVVAVLIERGADHPLVQTLWNNLPLEQHHDYAPDAVIEPAQILPEGREYYTYMGSLTTPPCSEDVLWMVMKQPVQLSSEQIAIFSRLYPMNARPVQPANDRLIKGSR
ncbi:MAG: carbonic anhydrase family protein [Rhodocyclaceae bacterium]|nr:carbonic anhydrase family protein [Rhodocyclaceae bacterium]